jgi:hypothetical protein
MYQSSSKFDCLQEQDVERARVAPSTYPTQGGLEHVHHEALSSNLGSESIPPGTCGRKAATPLGSTSSSAPANGASEG